MRGADAVKHEQRESFSSKSFWCLVATQFLGTLNDNMYRWLAVKIGEQLLGPDSAPLALSLGLFGFTLPFLLLATHAGFLADRFSKPRVIRALKVAEFGIILFGVLAIWSGQVFMLMIAVAALGAQSALFGPAKFGTLPEILPPQRLSAGNGIMGLATVTAAALGTVAGFWLFTQTKPAGVTNLWISAAALLSVAGLGWLASLGIRGPAAARPDLKFRINPLTGTWHQLRQLAAHRALLRTALGIAFFWSLASLAQMNVAVFGQELGLAEVDVSILMGVLVAGVGLGSVLAGVWSRGKVELGIVPLGATGIVIAAMGLYLAGSGSPGETTAAMTASASAWYWSCVWLFALGICAGLFNVPLDAYLQHRSPPEICGTILAASSFLAFTGILGTAGLFFVLQEVFDLTARQIFLLAGLGTIPVAIYVFCLLPQATIRFLVWLATLVIYRVRVYGRENLPETGGALLVANHVTWADSVFLLVASSRNIRMLAYADFMELPGINWLGKIYGVIPVKASEGPKSLLRSLQAARQAILNGELVCIFAEGALTRTGQIQPFQRGLLKIVEGTGAPVIPTYLDGLWGSIFSFSQGRFFKKWPKKLPYPVGIVFGPPIQEPDDVHEVRQAVQDLGVEAVNQRKQRDLVLPRRFLRQCRKSLFRSKLADSSGADLSGGQVLMRTLILQRLLERQGLGRDDKMVGVLLPPTAGGAMVNAALPLSGRIPVNLNYTATPEIINKCIAQCGMKHVITSKLFMTKMKLRDTLHAKPIYLEDLKEQCSRRDKVVAAALTYATPVWLLERMFGLTRLQPSDLMTIVFTSGSTGEPKGVMLSLHNVSSNIDAVDQLFQLKKTDVLVGVLPFFHSFGYTATMWLVFGLDIKGVYHYNPLEAREIGALCEKHKATILMATPTFLRTYLRRCEPEQFKTLDLVVVGAEKMPVDLAQAFEDKFHVRPIEGYGTTELSPLAAVNVPDHRSSIVQMGTKEGTVGRPIPNTTAKVVDPDTGADLGIDQPGLLLIRGPNVMQGYLNRPDLTGEVIRDEWYVTGDIAVIDAEGFIRITDRQSRFSKIGGEMVPHIKIEEMLNKILATGGDEDHELKAVVTAVADDKKGERLIVVHTPLPKPVEQVWEELAASGLPNLWVPSRDSFIEVEQIPVLGTGKLDLRGLKALAQARLAQKGPPVNA